MQGIFYLLQSWLIVMNRQINKAQLTPVISAAKIDQQEVNWVISYVDFLVKYGAVCTERKCFFRAYILANILRRQGLCLEMNIGMRTSQTASRTVGHCWLTIDGEVFEENDMLKKAFPFEIGKDKNGTHYWFNSFRCSRNN